jgi:hypothetical protein
MNVDESHEAKPVDTNGNLSTSFIKQTRLKVRMLAGPPSLLELGILSNGLRKNSSQATFDLFDEDGSLFSSLPDEPVVSKLVAFMHAKFAKVALVRSFSNLEMAYFDYSNDYFIFLGREEEIDDLFHLDLTQMSDYFNDNLETGLDEAYLRSVWKVYEPFM